jgi:hypothetical protein
VARRFTVFLHGPVLDDTLCRVTMTRATMPTIPEHPKWIFPVTDSSSSASGEFCQRIPLFVVLCVRAFYCCCVAQTSAMPRSRPASAHQADSVRNASVVLFLNLFRLYCQFPSAGRVHLCYCVCPPLCECSVLRRVRSAVFFCLLF